jgi:hypothetical protein
MSKKISLTPTELEYIRSREVIVGSVIESIQQVSQFRLGDFLIAYTPASPYGGKRQLMKNSYGAPKKFTVVHVDKYNVPYMKELNKKGFPIGNIISSIKLDNLGRADRSRDFEFEVDPDYADAIIMDDQDNFDATNIHKMKSDMFKDITNHNKSLKINCNDDKELIQFLKSLKVGDVVYKSIKTHFTILRIDPIPTTHNGTRLAASSQVFGQAQDSKGKIFDITQWTFKYAAIYKGRPRSYNELKDPK